MRLPWTGRAAAPAPGADAPGFAAFYDAQWRRRDRYFEIHRERFVQTWDFLAGHALPPGDALEVGGVGPLGEYLREQGWRLAESKSDLRHPLALPAGAFDLVICTETIEHIKDHNSDDIADLESFNYSGIVQMLGEFRRVARDGARLLLTTPNASSYLMLWKWLQGELLLLDPEHVREFSVDDLVRVCGLAGWAPATVTTRDTWSADFGRDFAALREQLAARPELARRPRGDNIFALFTRTR